MQRAAPADVRPFSGVFSHRVVFNILNNGEIMFIRHANMDDLAAISHVEKRCFPEAEAATEEEFRERLAAYADHFWLLFDEDGNLVSFIDGMATDEPDLADEMYRNASLHRADGRWQMIFGLNTVPEHRGKGYAASLVRRLVEDSRAKGKKGVVLRPAWNEEKRKQSKIENLNQVFNDAEFIAKKMFCNHE